jgi:hypothetical protein
MTDEAMSPLRRRMIEDMAIRKFAPKARHDIANPTTIDRVRRRPPKCAARSPLRPASETLHNRRDTGMTSACLPASKTDISRL